MGKKLSIETQPTDTTCGPTCLKAIYDFYEEAVILPQLIREIPSLETGGTLEAFLGMHALDRGFAARMYTYNLKVFDPTWFFPEPLPGEVLIDKLQKQVQIKKSKKLEIACFAYIEYLKRGGEIFMEDLSHTLILKYLKKGVPILTGLSSTYLYKSAREYVDQNRQVIDDVRGYPEGHFVVLENYDPDTHLVSVMDPWPLNPYSENQRYDLSKNHLMTSIMLGVLTYDANLMIITRKETLDEMAKEEEA